MQAPSPAVRKAVPADQASVEACVRAAYTPYIEQIGVSPAPLHDDYGKLIADGCVWLAVTPSAEVVGVMVMFVASDHILLDNYAVLPAWQDRGISKEFTALAKREARQRGIRTLRLYTNAKMSKNLEIYRRRGWVEVERRVEAGYDRVYMERQLGEEEGDLACAPSTKS
jgi:GNAT superfamily N-acetyltransferase